VGCAVQIGKDKLNLRERKNILYSILLIQKKFILLLHDILFYYFIILALMKI
jgi:hypothetical protein